VPFEQRPWMKSAEIADAIGGMQQLNKTAAEIMLAVGIHKDDYFAVRCASAGFYGRTIAFGVGVK